MSPDVHANMISRFLLVCFILSIWELWYIVRIFFIVLKRCVDEYVFMCFFVGNDFLPHLPSLEIREGAIDRLIRIYKQVVYKTVWTISLSETCKCALKICCFHHNLQGYLTENGIVNLERGHHMLEEPGEMEDDIFRSRKEQEENKQKNQRRMATARHHRRGEQLDRRLGWTPPVPLIPVCARWLQ